MVPVDCGVLKLVRVPRSLSGKESHAELAEDAEKSRNPDYFAQYLCVLCDLCVRFVRTLF